ncbi:MAG: hypothetical protein P9M15_03500 [Candidatus Electryoneaceae bacterium]|nr:hypothetical protein [Candidatus Electryoneaceae bacterium]
MKHLILVIVIVLASLLMSGSVYSQVIQEFTAHTEDHTVILEWSTNSADGVVEFRLQRSFDGRQFHTIAQIEPDNPDQRRGDQRLFRYVDDDLFKQRLHTYYYRIELVFTGGQLETSQTVEATLSFSSVLRTWGSIKAMFR